MKDKNNILEKEITLDDVKRWGSSVVKFMGNAYGKYKTKKETVVDKLATAVAKNKVASGGYVTNDDDLIYTPDRFEPISRKEREIEKLRNELRERGFSRKQINKLSHGNPMLHEKTATEIQEQVSRVVARNNAIREHSLLHDAIADAKAVRDIHREKAQVALEEAINPKIKDLLKKYVSDAVSEDKKDTYDPDDKNMQGWI